MSNQVNFLIAAYNALSDQDKQAFATQFAQVNIAPTKKRAKTTKPKLILPDPHFLAEMILKKHREKHGIYDTDGNESCKPEQHRAGKSPLRNANFNQTL